MLTSQQTAAQNPHQQYDYSVMYKSPKSIQIHRDWHERNLQSLKLPFERRVVNTRFGHTHLLVLGPEGAPPVVLIHGLVGFVNEWEDLLSYFAWAQTHRVYALDLPGVAPTSAPAQLKTTNSDWAIWLLDVLYALGIKRADFALMGSAAGIIFKLAALVPGRINSVVLLNPMGIGPHRTYTTPMLFLSSLLAMTFPHPKLIARLSRQLWAPGVVRPAYALDREVEHFIMMRKHLKPPQFFLHISDQELAKLTAPTLILEGQYNRMYNLTELAKRANRNIPRVKVETVYGAGADVEADQPRQVIELIARFLQNTAAYYSQGVTG